jgi:sulfate adenylyltransferase
MNQPYGGKLISFNSFDFTAFRKSDDWKVTARVKLDDRQLCDYEMLVSGSFSPLKGFMTEAEYGSVLENLHLPNKMLWPIPITLSIPESALASLEGKKYVVLEHANFTTPFAVMKIESLFKLNKEKEMLSIFGSKDAKHPAVKYLNQTGSYAVGGEIIMANAIPHYDFPENRNTPKQLRESFEKMGWNKIVAFQTRNPMHRAHFELTLKASEKSGANILVNPVVGLTKDDDIDPFTRVRCYYAVFENYPKGKAALSLLPLAMRMAGPKEALLHMIIRKNLGCTHFIVGRDHAGPGKDSTGKSFYGDYEAQEFAIKYKDEIGIESMRFDELLYSGNQKKYLEKSEVKDSDEILKISGTEFREKLNKGEEIPSWFSFPKVTAELRKSTVPSFEKGICLFFTGFSGAGKTTLARAIEERLKAKSSRKISILDGDEVREHLSKGLTFSKEDRDENIRRISYVASLVVKHQGIAICSPIAPYENVRQYSRKIISEVGHFVQIYVSTSIETCEKRDPKGLYQKARAGEVKHFTGVDDPYEVPSNSELEIDTSKASIQECVNMIISFLKEKGYLRFET